ncbi:MAG: hypothetical protein M3O33_09625 [Cyanobacteriota bacterium]|nr:hypothetical protein [Cyanobacteriota bacterium]
MVLVPRYDQTYLPSNLIIAGARRQRSGNAKFLKSLGIAEYKELQAAMERSHIQHYVAVQSQDYEPLAKMYDTAIQAGYEVIG